MTTLRWLHLSDFHVGKDGYGQSRLFHYILEHVRSRVEAGLAPDFVFITGDIANKGQAAHYQEFNEGFLLPLISLLPSEAQNRVYLIPGNHDVDRSQTRAAQTYDVQVKIPEFFDPTERGKFERYQTVFPRFQAFVDNDMINIDGHWLFSPEGVSSSIVSFADQRIGILGINTAWLSHSDYDRNRLSVGKALLETGLEKIKEAELKFILGHHPTDWLLDSEIEPVRALLGRYNTIYLHGHMHKGRAKYEGGAGYPFLAIQTGACFQAREDDLWVNRFLWCEIDMKTHEISVEPLQWSRDNQEWVLDSLAFPEQYRQGDRWIVSLPSPTPMTGKTVGKAPISKVQELPKGWVIIDKKYLKGLASDLTAEQALSFFDGRTPIWREALAPQIPRREIVLKVTEALDTVRKAGGIQVTLLLGASGEGKTTALLQTICNLVNSNNDWRVLWHDDPTSPFPAEFIARLPKGATWLIASDDAELIARRVYDTTQLLTERRDIQFLLCCRDTDWRGTGVDAYNWKRHNVNFVEIPLRGLSVTDAEEVIRAWSKYGKEGLKQLDTLPLKDATLHLLGASKSEETKRSEGTFFGAVLQVRLGDGLKEHVESLLEKLSKRSIDKSRNLRDAFSYIAAMHAEGLQILSKEVLAEVLHVKLGDLKRLVLAPLGEEAAIATTGQYVFTRHRSIANVAVQILSDDLGVDLENLYIDLVHSARYIRRENRFVPNLIEWEFLSSHFFNEGKKALGIRLAQAALEVPGNEAHLIVKLAQLYRESSQAGMSVDVFRSSQKLHKTPRGYYHEWAVAEGSLGNQAISVWLYAYGLSDQAARQPPSNDDGKWSLNGLSVAFRELHSLYNLPAYIAACGAASELGLCLRLDSRAEDWLRRSLRTAEDAGYKDLPPLEAFDKLLEGIVTAWKQREDELPEWIPQADLLSFNDLSRLLRLKS